MMDWTAAEKPVRTYIEDHREELVSVTRDLLAFDTQNPPGETATAMTYVSEYLEDAGIETERVAIEEAKPNLLASVPGRRDDTFVFNGHLDTVPFDSEDWEYDPLGTVVGDRIYGRGATDMKGQLAAMMVALTGLAGSDVALPVNVALLVVSDEEVPSDVGIDAIVESDVFQADACLIGETTSDAERYSLTVADKGSIWLTLEATGAAAHGSRPMLGENAIDRLYSAVEDIRRTIREDPFALDPSVAPIVEESIEYYGPVMGQAAADRLFRYPTVNLGRLDGGTSINAVPEHATAKVDIRLTAGVDVEAVLSTIRSRVDRTGGVSIASVHWSDGTFEPLDTPLVRATVDAAESVLDGSIARRSATGGGDAKTCRNATIPTVEFGLGTETAHGVDEYTTQRALLANAEVYSRLPFTYAVEADGDR